MKTCQHNECTYRVFGGGYCKNHQYLREDFKHSQLKRTPVKKQSDKERMRLQQYRKLRIEYLKQFPKCEVDAEGCTKGATQVHHRSGRIGGNLLDMITWLSVCHNCHHLIETRPAWAKLHGFSISRLNKAS